MTTLTSCKSAADTPCLDQVSRDRIGAKLRAAYEALAKEPIPDQHVHLILALRHKEREQRRAYAAPARV